MALSSSNTFTTLFPAISMALLLAVVFHPVPVSSQAALPPLPSFSPPPPAPVSPCTSSMLTSFTPCMGFLTNSSTNATAPSPGCCSSLKSMTSNGTGCLCQFFTGAVPFQIPINRTLAISLPKACNMAGVPLQCNVASGAPAPAPVAMTPSQSPTTAASPSQTGPAAVPASSPAAAAAASPTSDSNPTLTPPTTTSAGSPTATSTTTSRGSADSNPASSSAIRSLQILSQSSLLVLPLALAAMINY